MKRCPNPCVRHPVKVKIIQGDYEGHLGWASKKANEVGVKIFCDRDGHFPYQYNCPSEYIELFDW